MATAPKSTEATSEAPRLSLSGSNDGKWIVNYVGPVEGSEGAYDIVNALVAKIKAEHGDGPVRFSAKSGSKPAASGGAPRRSGSSDARPAPAASRDPIFCEACDGEIKPVTFKDGKTFTAAQVAGWGTKNFDMALCSNDYQKAKKGELDLSDGGKAPKSEEDVPF